MTDHCCTDGRISAAVSARIRLYIRTLGIPEPQAEHFFAKTKEYLEASGLSAQKDCILEGVKFLREQVKPLCPAPVRRTAMTYKNLPATELRGHQNKGQASQVKWQISAFWRRLVLFTLLIISVAFGILASMKIFSSAGISPLEWVLILIFSNLFAWVTVNFITSLFGIYLFLRKKDPFDPLLALEGAPEKISAQSKIAVLLPIYNEEVPAVFAGVHVLYESLVKTGQDKHFTLFILSDTSDPDLWAKEEVSWRKLCRELNAEGRIFYRHRKSRLGRKSGNIADFCRRWGKDFTYMIVLDSDSIMDGSAMVDLARVMDRRPSIGILQTVPQSINSTTFLARLQQFAGHVYGPFFTLGQHFWQLGDSVYWGHNAIIRMYPFMKYCNLPKLTGWAPFGGVILSHDFVEAALMRRAGWEVWVAYGIKGSYEQLPSTLIAELDRDRRWCQGNLQHLRFTGRKGFSLGHRYLFIQGNMFYAASLLWFLFMLLGTADTTIRAVAETRFFPYPVMLFPEWPVQYHGLSAILLSVTLAYLFLPKFLAAFIVSMENKARSFGGRLRLIAGVIMEIIFSIFLAPIRMFYHSFYFATSLFGGQVDWRVSPRFARGIRLRDSFRLCFIGTALAGAWAFYLYHLDRMVFWWLSVVLIPFLFSIPVSFLVSRVGPGTFLRKIGLLLVPQESCPSPELVNYNLRREEAEALEKAVPVDSFISALFDPLLTLFHLNYRRKETRLPSIGLRRRLSAEKALFAGDSLSAGEKKELLSDPLSRRFLHERIWGMAEDEFAAWRKKAGLV